MTQTSDIEFQLCFRNLYTLAAACVSLRCRAGSN
jgi:hypothetical protein